MSTNYDIPAQGIIERRIKFGKFYNLNRECFGEFLKFLDRYETVRTTRY